MIHHATMDQEQQAADLSPYKEFNCKKYGC